MPQQRNHHETLQRRHLLARTEGYRTYGQKRYQLEKAARQKAASPQAQLQALFPDAVLFTDLPKQQKKAYNRLAEYGVNRRELNDLLASGPDFWKQARPMLERESELAKGH